MFSRLVFTLVLLFVSVFSSHGLRAAHGGFCTVAEVEQWYFAGESLEAIQNHCQVLDVTCSVADVYGRIDGGSSLADVYYYCQ